MAVAARVSRQERTWRIIAKIRDRSAPYAAPLDDPGPLLDFVPRLTPRFRAPTHLADLADSIERAAAGERVRACFSVPVRHGKTSLCQHAIAWLLRKDPTRSILYVSYAHGFAKKQTGKAKELAARAGVVLGQGRRQDEWWTRAGGFVKAAGIGGQITGEGFTDIFVDDPHKNRAEAESRTIREGVIEAFFSDIYTRLDPRGTSYYVVHARWNVNDLIGVLSRAEPHPFERFNAPALSEDNEPLAPWLFDRAQLEELRDTLGPYTWASLYQGEPRPRGGALFQDPTFTSDISRPRNFRTAIGIDLAWSTRSRADHNAAVVMRMDMDSGLLTVLESVRARGTIMDRMRDREIVDEGFARQVVRLLHEHPEASLFMYANEAEKPLVLLFQELLESLIGRTISIHALKIMKDKYGRAQRYAASWNTGRVRMPGRTTVREAGADDDDEGELERIRGGWQNGFALEHTEFTGVKGAEDDQVDAATAAHDGLVQTGEATSLEEAMQSAGTSVYWG